MQFGRILPILALAAAGCGKDSLSLSGSLVPGSEATEVFVLGGAERAQITADSFSISAVTSDTVELRFAAGDGEPARMLLTGLPSGGRVHLEGIWIEDGMAHAARVHTEESSPVLVNGFRMVSPSTQPQQVDAAGTVLSASRQGDAILVRPADEALPDLRVVITPGTVLRRMDGGPGPRPGDAGVLEYGDSVRVVGQGVDGYVVATEVVLPGERRD